MRPTAEYREPTDREWREFTDHFQLRKLELVDPRQRHRLAEIITSLRERITEARANGWFRVTGSRLCSGQGTAS